MAGIGRLQNKISFKADPTIPKKPIAGKIPLPSAITLKKLLPSSGKTSASSTIPVLLESVSSGPPSKHSLPPKSRQISSDSQVKPLPVKKKFASFPTTPVPPQSTSLKKPLSPKDKLYEQISSDSQQENLERQRFIARVQGKSEPGEIVSPQANKKEQVVFQPVPQKPTRARKIIIRLLVVILLASLGLLLYIIFQGYLI